MSSDFPTLAEVGEKNVREQDEWEFRTMMRCAPVDYHIPYRREDHD